MSGERIRELIDELPVTRLLATLGALCAVLPSACLAVLLYPLRSRRARLDRRRLRTANMVLRMTKSNSIKRLQ